MNICIPILEDKGTDSQISDHFGSAPCFIIFDTETNNYKIINNQNTHKSHGMCQPLKVLSNESFDSIIVTGIGRGAVKKLKSSNKKVYKTSKKEVKDIICDSINSKLDELDNNSTCSSHSCNGHD